MDRFDWGELQSLKGIEGGIENTNYHVITEEGNFILTLVEQYNYKNSRWFIELVNFIANRGFPVPIPVSDRNGIIMTKLADKPVVLTQFIDGETVQTPTETIAEKMGDCIGLLHTITQGYAVRHPFFRDVQWCRRQRGKIAHTLSPGESALIERELNAQLIAKAARLPMGAIHADLFRDNVFFINGELNGVIDFWHSGVDSLLYDLAVACNDWCWNGDRFHEGILCALLRGYCARRPLTDAENEQWQMELRRAALRFWLSRLGDARCPRKGLIISKKNPDEQRQLLQYLLDQHIPTPRELLPPA